MTPPSAKPYPMTFGQAALLDPDEEPGDLVNGEWAPARWTGWRHGEIVGNVCTALKDYARQRGGWVVAAGRPGVMLTRSPDTLRGPDVVMVPAERCPMGKGVAGWLDGGPELAVEVLGDSQNASELLSKGVEYLTAGGHMVWVLDPGPKLITVLTAPDRFRVLGVADELDGGDVLPGFRCSVAELFA